MKNFIERDKFSEMLSEFMATDAEVLLQAKTDSFEFQIKYVGRADFNGSPAYMFTMIDFKDPWTKKPHGYPKMFTGDVDEFYAECEREFNYLSDIHAPRKRNSARTAIALG